MNVFAQSVGIVWYMHRLISAIGKTSSDVSGMIENKSRDHEERLRKALRRMRQQQLIGLFAQSSALLTLLNATGALFFYWWVFLIQATIDVTASLGMAISHHPRKRKRNESKDYHEQIAAPSNNHVIPIIASMPSPTE
jgi:hypothetical protein